MTLPISISSLNGYSHEDFTNFLAEVFEHSSWIAERTWAAKPFTSIDDLHEKMLGTLYAAPHIQQLRLLCAHPQLAGQEAHEGTLTDASSEEQAAANLNSLTKKQALEITSLNKEYLKKFRFPFIIAVKNHNKADILSEFRERIDNHYDIEFTTALKQVAMIGRFRLNALLIA